MSDKKNKWQDIEEQAEQAEGLEQESREELEEELNEADQEIQQYKDEALRARAELENVRRRSEREVDNAYKYGNKKLLEDLLPVVDSLTRGLEGKANADAAATSVYEGMQLTLDLLNKTLEKHGVTMINPEVGAPFNPDQHEAMSMLPTEGAEPNTIVQVLQPGYLLKDRVVRAAMVIVSA